MCWLGSRSSVGYSAGNTTMLDPGFVLLDISWACQLPPVVFGTGFDRHCSPQFRVYGGVVGRPSTPTRVSGTLLHRQFLISAHISRCVHLGHNVRDRGWCGVILLRCVLKVCMTKGTACSLDHRKVVTGSEGPNRRSLTEDASLLC